MRAMEAESDCQLGLTAGTALRSALTASVCLRLAGEHLTALQTSDEAVV